MVLLTGPYKLFICVAVLAVIQVAVFRLKIFDTGFSTGETTFDIC